MTDQIAELGQMPEITPESMDTLTVADVARICEEVGLVNQAEQNELHRYIRHWTNKGLIYSWGRAGQTKTSGHLYNFDQVYIAAFVFFLVANTGHEIEKLAAAIDFFAGGPPGSGLGNILPENYEGRDDLQERCAGAVYYLSQGWPCHFVRTIQHKDRDGFMGLVVLDPEKDGESLGTALQIHGTHEMSCGLDLTKLIKPILERDPRHEVGAVPHYLSRDKGRGSLAREVYDKQNAALGRSGNA